MWLNARWFFCVMAVLCFFLLVFPIFTREKYSSGLLIDGDSYRSVRIANDIRNGEDISYDWLSYGGRIFVEERAWYYLLSPNPEILAKYLPAVFGLLSFILFYLIAGHIKPSIKGIASLLLIISPPYMYLFSTATKYSAAIFFVLLGFYLLLKDKQKYSYAAFFFAGLFSIFSLLIVVLILLCKDFRKRKFLDFAYIFIGFLVLSAFYFKEVFAYGFPSVFFRIDSFNYSEFFSSLFFIFGANSGMGFFFFILVLIGIYSMFKNKYFYVFIYAFLGFILYLSFYIKFLLPYAAFVFAFYAGRGFMILLDHDWRSGIFKFLTLLVVCCGLLFNLVIFVNGVSFFYPDNEYSGAIEFLSEEKSNDAVFAHYKNGEIISYSGNRNFMDSRFAYAPGLLEREEAYYGILGSKDINLSENLMDEYGIRYILVDEQMRDEYFEDNEEGLLFILKYSPLKFSLAYSNNKVQIWERI